MFKLHRHVVLHNGTAAGPRRRSHLPLPSPPPPASRRHDSRVVLLHLPPARARVRPPRRPPPPPHTNRPPTIITGHFSGGENLRFAPDRSYNPRSFSLFSRRPARATTDTAVLHVFATLTLAGTHISRSHTRPHSVSFDLEGYYYSAGTPASAEELCMVGSGSYAREDGFGVVLLSDAVLRLHVPWPANLSRPFLTGTLEGADFGDVALVAYAEADYVFGGVAAPCPTQPAPAGGAPLQRRHKRIRSCARLKAVLRGSYNLLEYGHDASESPLRLSHRRMYLDQMRCDGPIRLRAYIAFDTNTNMSVGHRYNYTAGLARGLAVGDEALVAEGFWIRSRNQLCLRACRVVRSGPSRAGLAVRECDVGISIWFPTVWSIRDRSVASGMIWNTTSKTSSDDSDKGKISVSRSASYRDDLSYITYNYTRVEEAKKHYDLSAPSLRKGRFPGNDSYQDLAFSFYLNKRQGSASVYGYASPVAIGSAVVQGDRLMAFDSFYGNWTAEMEHRWLMNVSYDLQYYAAGWHLDSSANLSRQWLSRQQRISAEGVYDTTTGSLYMVGCQLISSNGSVTDCEILVTAQFAPVDTDARERVVGTISSLRKKQNGDPLFFEPLDFTAEGMYAVAIHDSVSRMDMERVMLVVSMTLSCVFTGLQLLHVKRHPEALPATSVTMLVVLAVGYALPLVLNLEAMFADAEDSRRDNKRFVRLTSVGMLELNEFVMRVSSMLAFVLQLRLLQLALASRQRPAQEAAGGSKQEDDDSDAERSTLWICLSLYALGAVLVWIVHLSGGDMHSPLYRPRAFADDLAGCAGLILDGFLLPQVVWNAFAGSRVQALSPWFYAGVSLVRAAPHAYDVFRRHNYVPSLTPSYVYANPRDDLFGVAWDVAVPCGAAVLAMLVFFQQRLGGAFMCGARGRRPGGYEMVSTLAS
ncbi:hypothetical protein PR202_ga10148 [Eleusine coracana subsp. coracana]|uniref:RING-type E3 ubiquitin transferase n=1 Tax=Eleusine coracana subsp. coracana TaxID=191504 RepID=A0AAV5C5Z2_ELECO|nr:hypothetical protein PR202_ga10148 [Eleusine coracana subsp. coracana]